VRLDYSAGFIEHADDRRVRARAELRGTRRKKFPIAGAFSASVDNGERLRKSAEVF